MEESAAIRVYDSQSQAYHDAFAVFLAHTDQKVNARAWLDAFLEREPSSAVFVDAGAGTGQTTSWLGGRFGRVVALEPNPSLCQDLRQTCPAAEVLPVKILDARLPATADFVLCSHVLYYLPRDEWQPSLGHMSSWLKATGALVVVLQNHQTDCMGMLDHFLGLRFNGLGAIAQRLEQDHGQRYRTELHVTPAHVTAPDLPTAYVIAEFMLNLLPIPNPPTRHALEEYIRSRFSDGNGGFRFSCHQDFLVVRPRGQ
jgi:SAM-dependent methyltransferase